MNLEKILNGLPLLRPWGVPFNLGKVCLIIMRDNLAALPGYLEARPWVALDRIMLPDYAPDCPEYLDLGKAGRVRLEDMSQISKIPQCEKLFVWPPAWILGRICQAFRPLGLTGLWLDGAWPQPFGLRAPLPDFYDRNARNLDRVMEMLENEEDRECYAGRIKAILTGNAGFIPIAAHAEYEHPLIRPESGDIMIDGGISDMVGAQESFARHVGPEGRIMGFEPISWMAKQAAAQLAPFPNYRLINAGLADRAGEAVFASLRDSSHLCEDSPEGNGTERCRLTTIDQAVAKEKFSKVDCIKLDIEGAELAALAGAARTIRKFRPKLIICLYHKPDDMITIPLFIKTLVPEYRLHVAHSSCDFTDTILYAHAPGTAQ